jgi:1-acyl-sn-glycerol-3-phosphate acyltransferase
MSTYPKRSWFYRLANWALRWVFRLLLRLDIRGIENVPRQGPVIFAISHSSFLDPVIIGPHTPRDVVPMAKIEAFDLPVLGLVLRLYGAFAVRRGEVDLTAIKTALKVLQSGQCLVIAPEGHRSETGALQRGREGAIILALRSGAPILPVAIWGGKKFWKNLVRLRRTEMMYYIGKPVTPIIKQPTREQIAAMSDELMLLIAQMMPPELHGYYAGWSMPAERLLQPCQGEEVANVK